ncbi:uncharacterized protein LOC126745651 isoform X2 [Anthonomus grandis grandis]|uniref:uncharacterized protein LOC126745651 isoform X2 n=1 Tax=Anthonomus grandis grandis TaxID=2921223 RepID=UPI0021657400|nr:uncharacterized protein LOC126745651 isoform X2 [Anthonomus grandis grandis]
MFSKIWIEVKMTPIKGACSPSIQDYIILISPPDPKLNAINWDTHERFATVDAVGQATFTIKPYTIGQKPVEIIVYPVNKQTKSKRADSKKAKFTVKLAKPIVNMNPEYYARKTYGFAVEMDAKNPNIESNSDEGLTITWTCILIDKQGDNPLCTEDVMNGFKDKKKISIPNSIESVNRFQLVAKVALKDDPSIFAEEKTVIFFKPEGTAPLSITCQQNKAPVDCLKLSSFMKTNIVAGCGAKSNLEDFNNCSPVFFRNQPFFFTWIFLTIDTFKPPKDPSEIELSKITGLDKSKVLAESGALIPGAQYLLRFQLKAHDGSVIHTYLKQVRIMEDLSALTGCEIMPKKGTAGQTGFRIKGCNYEPGSLNFEIYSIIGKKTSLLAKTNKIETEVFVLPVGSKVRLDYIDSSTGNIKHLNFDVEVTKSLDSNQPTEALVNDIKNKLNEAANVGKDDKNMAMQIIGAVEEEFSKLPGLPAKELDRKILDVIKKIDITNAAGAQQAANILEHIANRYNQSDPDISVEAAVLCQKAGQTMLEDAKLIKNPEIMKERLTNAMKSLSGCSQVGLKPNPEEVAQPPIDITVPTTDSPLLPPKGPLEHYPDYVDDESASEKASQYEVAATLMESMCFTNSKLLIYTMDQDERPLINEQGSMVVVSAKMTCQNAVSQYVTSPEALVKASQTCHKKNVAVVNIMMCTTDKNPYWYIDNIPLYTPVLYLNFTGIRENSSEDIDLSGEDYFSIKLVMGETLSWPSLKIQEADLPLKAITDLNDDNQISTHRIFVPRGRGFTVQFINLAAADSYDVTLLDFEKPTLKTFQLKRIHVDQTNNVIVISRTHPYDCFWFLSVLPSERVISGSKVYQFTVSSIGCYVWNQTAKFWQPSCRAEETTTKNITCHCKSGTTFTGYRRDIVVTYEEEEAFNFKLQISYCWIIYAATLVTFTVFTLLLFMTSFERDDDILEMVFFVGDVPSFYEYAYLIYVNTGKKKHAGTTSNVTVKLRGTEGDSLEHVLNYPDPDLVMMQRKTECWFVVASQKRLGDITELEIWFDSLGNNTNWYCSKIEIFDLQTSAAWLFELENWFNVTKEGHHKFVLTPVKRRSVSKENAIKSSRIANAIRDLCGKLEIEVNLWTLSAKDALLSRKERVMLIFTAMFLMYVIIMFIYSVPQFNESDTIDMNSFGFHINIIWTPLVGSSIAFLITCPFVYLFKRGKLIGNRNMNKCTVICHIEWSLLIFILLASVTALIVCGFFIPTDTSLLWLISSALAVLINWFFLQNLSRIFYIYCIKLHIQAQSFAETIKRIINYVELQRIWVYKRFGALGLRPYLKHLYYDLDYISLKERIKWEYTKLRIKEILDDLMMIILYVTLLYLMLMLDREQQAIYSHKEVKKLVEFKTIDRKPVKVRSIKSMENYITEMLLPSVQSLKWYGKFIQENPGMTRDFSNTYLGVIRLRQHRTQEVHCKIPPEMMDLTWNQRCRPDFGRFIDRGQYSKDWQPPNQFINATGRMTGVWKYRDSSVTKAPFYFGEYAYYPGGGYVATLGRNLKNSLINMQYLQKHKWFDLRTRAVFLEFLNYNPNVNLFNGVTVIFERNSAGYIIRHFEILTRKFLLIDRNRIFTLEVTSSLFAISIFILVVRVLYKLVKKRAAYFNDVWSLFDIVIILLTGISIYFSYARDKAIKSYIKTVSNAKNNEFIPYFHLFDTDDLLTVLTGSLVFVATLRLWKLLRFMVIIKIAEKTISLSWKSLLVCMLYQTVYLIAFSAIFVIFISSSGKDFRDYPTAFTTLLLLSMNLYNNFNVKQFDNHPLGVLFYVVFMLFSLLFMTVYIAIVNIYYADAKDLYADDESQVKKFVQEKWKYYKNLLRVRRKNLRGGEDIEPDDGLVIKPKSGERFEDAIAVPKNRMDAMTFISMCVLRKREGIKITTEEDFQLMSKTIKALYGKSSKKDIFFITGDSQHIQFVANRRLCQIADLCEKLVRISRNDVRASRKIGKTIIQTRLDRINVLIENIDIISDIFKNIQLSIK